MKTLTVIGIKYMLGSVEEKAQHKKTMIPFIIGVIMIVAIMQFVRILISIVENIQS